MKRTIILILTVLMPFGAGAQLTLERCREAARENYPTIRQLSLVEQSRDFTVTNAKRGNLPQLTLNAKAQYQSDATKFPAKIEGINFEGLPRDQYDISLSITQTVYDGGIVSNTKKVAEKQGDVDIRQVEVALYDVYQRVDEIYFSILMLDEQIEETALLQEDLRLSMELVSAMLRGGIAMQSDVDAVAVQQIESEQNEVNLRTTRDAYICMLSTFMGEDIAEDATFERPASIQSTEMVNNRPELELYTAQGALLDAQMKTLNVDTRPHIGLFATAGYANPALNLFKNGFEAYYTIGAQLTWNFSNLYTRSNDKKLIEVQRETIASERDAFILNTELQGRMQDGAILSLQRQIEQDDQIIALRESIRDAAETRVENGTETVNEMLRDINAVSEARQQKDLHEIQLLQEIYKLKNIYND